MATARAIAEEVAKILKEDKEFKIQKNLTPFQRTEKLLYELKYLKGAIEVKRERLSGLHNAPVLLSKKETGVNVQATKKYLSEVEKIENLIENCENEIKRLEHVVNMTENALKNIEDDKYYKIIELKYFEEMTLEYAAGKFNVDITTIKRNKNRLINRLRALIFSDNVIQDIMNY
jgi:hypothetical protein|nr:MAG TPA: Protein of unknown function (DUF722) [Bacteriophage sp.]